MQDEASEELTDTAALGTPATPLPSKLPGLSSVALLHQDRVTLLTGSKHQLTIKGLSSRPDRHYRANPMESRPGGKSAWRPTQLSLRPENQETRRKITRVQGKVTDIDN